MIRPFFENKRVRLFCGNSLDVLQELKANNEHFDLMLTDPPYGLNQKNNKASGINAKRAKASYKDDIFDDTFDYLKETVRPIFDLSMSICNLGIITAGVGFYKYLPPPDEEGCMYMPASPSFNTWAHSDFRPIWYYGKPKGNYGKYRCLSFVVTEQGFSKNHPCSKPLTFWKKLMLCGTDGEENKTILDPFAGSGTTGRAAQDLCMKATLIEINPRYCELIAKNCSQETLF